VARRIASFVAVLALLAMTETARAVLIDSHNGAGNTTAPGDDPGWDNVGLQGKMSCVYLGDGWVLTVNHASVEGVTSVFRGVSYAPDLASRIPILHPDGSRTDLQLFRLATRPDLPRLRIRADPPAKWEAVTMIGNGRDRGAQRRDLFQPRSVRDGWELIPNSQTKRWGTNQIAEVDLHIVVRGFTVQHFTTRFDRGLPTPHEANGTLGDSGGGVFTKKGGIWELAGIMFANDSVGKPNENLILLSTPPSYLSRTYSIDLSHYRAQILRLIGSESATPAEH
jgi:hypothetical protein